MAQRYTLDHPPQMFRLETSYHVFHGTRSNRLIRNRECASTAHPTGMRLAYPADGRTLLSSDNY